MTAGGLPPRRPDQRLISTTRSGTGPAPQNGVFARLFVAGDIIINSQGAFFYDGTPAKGTLVIAIAPNAGGTDQFGNVYPQGTNFGVWNASGALEQHFGINPSGDIFLASSTGVVVMHGQSSDGSLEFYSTAGQGLGNIQASIAPAAGTDGAGNNYVAGLASYSAALSLFSQLISGQLFLGPWTAAGGGSSSTVLSYVTGSQGFGYTSGTAGVEQATDGPGGIIARADLLADDGSGGGGQLNVYATSGGDVFPVNLNLAGKANAVIGGATPAIETWHNIGLSATWTAAGAGTLPQYRLNVTGMVDVKGDIIFTSTGVGLSGSNAFTGAAAIPAAYRPAVAQLFDVYLTGGTGNPTIGAHTTPIAQLSTGGQWSLLNVSSTGGAGLTVGFGFKGSYQLAN